MLTGYLAADQLKSTWSAARARLTSSRAARSWQDTKFRSPKTAKTAFDWNKAEPMQLLYLIFSYHNSTG